MGAMPANEQGDGPLQYSEKLSPAINHFLAEASRQDVRVRGLPLGGLASEFRHFPFLSSFLLLLSLTNSVNSNYSYIFESMP